SSGLRRCLPCWLALPLSLAIQHLQLARDDLGGVTVGAVLGLPLPGAQTALNVYLRALAQVLASDLGQAVEKHHGVPLGALLHLTALLVLPGFAGGDGDVGDGSAGRHVADFRILAEVTDQNDLVDSSCHCLLALS